MPLFLFQRLDYKKVFIVPLHQVLFPGVLFYGGGVELQVFRELTIFCYLFFEVLLGLPEVTELSPSLHLREQVIAVKKQHPHHEANGGQHEFVSEKRRNAMEQFHLAFLKKAMKYTGSALYW